MDRIEELIQNNKYVQECDSLPWDIKLKVWVYYACRKAKLKVYTYQAIKKNIVFCENPFKDENLVSIDEFYLKKFIYVNIGNSWNKQGYAQKDWIDYHPDTIYYWYSKIK